MEHDQPDERQRRDRTRGGEQVGAAAVEFAIIIPIFVLLVFGAIYFGITIFRGQVIESAAREGARVASVGGEYADVTSAVQSAATGFAAAELTVTVTSTDNPGNTGTAGQDVCESSSDVITVRVQATADRFNFSLPFFDGGDDGEVRPNFDAPAVFECERTP